MGGDGGAGEVASWRFIRFDAGRADTVWCGDARAFLLATPDGKPVLVDGICPHRGGPLALGQYDCRSESLRCPWHGRRHPRRQLLAGAWPAIRCGADWVVALPADGAEVICFPGARPELSHVPASLGEPGASG